MPRKKMVCPLTAEQVLQRRSYETAYMMARSLGVSLPVIWRWIREAEAELPEFKPAHRRSRIDFTELMLDPAKLKAVREKTGLTQRQMALIIGAPKVDMIREWERGKDMSTKYLLRWMLLCGVGAQELATDNK